MSPHEAAALAANDAAFAEPITYTGGGLLEPTSIAVIWSDVAADPFPGAGNTARRVSCEVPQAALSKRPGAADRITRDGLIWRPNDVTDRDDIAKWAVVLEKVGPAS